MDYKEQTKIINDALQNMSPAELIDVYLVARQVLPPGGDPLSEYTDGNLSLYTNVVDSLEQLIENLKEG